MINGHDNVRPAVILTVSLAIDQLRYSVNEAARERTNDEG
jgi:DNA-binding LacI/PurR family transcriptional regulator